MPTFATMPSGAQGENGGNEVASLTKDPVAAPPAALQAQEATPMTGGKRKTTRMSLSLREKAVVKSFCEQKVNDSKARGELVPSQEMLRREVAAELGWNCGRSTLSKILALDWRALRSGQEGGDAPRNTNMKRRRRPLFPAFEADLVKFIAAHLDPVDVNGSSECVKDDTRTAGAPPSSSELTVAGPTALTTPSTVSTANGSEKGSFTDTTAHHDGQIRPEATPNRAGHAGGRGARARVLTEALILEEAQRLKQVHGVTDEELVLSVGWLARFKHRNNIRLRKPAGSGKSPPSMEAMATAVTSPMGIWSANLGVSTLTTTGTSGPLSSQTPSTTAPADTNYGGLTPSVQPCNSQQHASASESGELKRSLLCGAQWQQLLPFKDHSVWMRLLMQLPEEVRALACPCQVKAVENQLPQGIAGLHVVVLGAGSIVEAFLAAALVGPGGLVACLETSADNVALAVQAAERYCIGTLGFPAVNMRFLAHAAIGTSPASLEPPGNNELKELWGHADLAVFNCSFQSLETLAAKRGALQLGFKLLKLGGELRVTDVGCSRRVSPSEREQVRAALTADSCAGTVLGEPTDANKHLERLLLLVALYVGDLQRLCRALGSDVDDRSVGYNAAGTCVLATPIEEFGAQFHRVIFRVFRVADVEVPCEDYGQLAVYNGGDLSSSSLAGGDSGLYRLDDSYSFPRGERVPVDGNTAQILQTSWLRRLFSVEGDRSKHRGAFFVLKRPETESTAAPPQQASHAVTYAATATDPAATSEHASPALPSASTGSVMEPLEMADI